MNLGITKAQAVNTVVAACALVHCVGMAGGLPITNITQSHEEMATNSTAGSFEDHIRNKRSAGDCIRDGMALGFGTGGVFGGIISAFAGWGNYFSGKCT